MNSGRLYTPILLLWLAIAAGAQAQTLGKGIAVVLEEPRQKLPDLTLVSRLQSDLSLQEATMPQVIPGQDTTLAAPPRSRFDLEQLISWGHDAGCRYIIYLQIDKRGIFKRKQLGIPFVFNRYVVEGQVDGTYTLVDLIRCRIAGSWKLKTRLTGPRSWQVGENYPEDPDLNIAAPEKLTFLKNLEDKAATEIMTTVQPHLRGK